MGNTYGTIQEKSNKEIITDEERYNMLITLIRRRPGYGIERFCDYSNFMDDKRFIMSVLEIGNITFNINELSPRLQNDREVVNTALQKGCGVNRHIRDKIYQDREYALSHLKGSINEYCPDFYEELGEFKYDLDFALEAIKCNPKVYEYMPKKIRGNIQITYEAVKRNGKMIDYASERLRKNDKLIKIAVETNIHALLYASQRLTDDYDFMMKLVKRDVVSMSYASDRLKDNYKFVNEIMIETPCAINYASKRLMNDKVLLAIALQDENNKLRNVFQNMELDTMLYFKDHVLKRLKDNPNLIKLDMINDNYELMVEYVKMNPYHVYAASKRLINDIRFLKSLLNDKNSYISDIISRIAPENVLLFKDDIIKRIAENPPLFAYLDDELLNNREFMQQLINSVPVLSKYFNKNPAAENVLLEQQNVETNLKRRKK